MAISLANNKRITIDIGSRFIKIAELHKKNKGLVVLNKALLETPEDCYNDGYIIEKEAIAKKIISFINDNNIKTKDVTLSVSSSKIITREVTLPKVNSKQLKQLINSNAQEYFPVQLEDYVIDYSILEEVENEGEKQLRIFLTAAPIYIVNQYVELVEMCGLKLFSIDYDGISMQNLIKSQSYTDNYIILDMGYSKTMVSIFSEGNLKFNRSIMVGMSIVANAISNHFNLSMKEAEQKLIKEIFNENSTKSDGDNNRLNDLLEYATGQIFDVISRYITYFKSRNNEKDISKIYLTGGGATIKGLDKYIENRFKISTQKIEKLNLYLNSSNNEDDEKILFYSICLGSIYSKVNLLPIDVAKNKEVKEKRKLWIELIILGLLVVTLLLIFPFNKIRALQSEKDLLIKNIEYAKSQGVIELSETIDNKSKDLQFRKDVLSLAGIQGEQLNNIIDKMEEKIPKDLFYISLSTSEQKITFQGIAKDKETVAYLIQSLRDIDEITDVYVSNMLNYKFQMDSKEEFINFTIQCGLNSTNE